MYTVPVLILDLLEKNHSSLCCCRNIDRNASMPPFWCTVNAVQGDIEAWWQNKMFASELPLSIDSKTWIMIPKDPQLPAATN